LGCPIEGLTSNASPLARHNSGCKPLGFLRRDSSSETLFDAECKALFRFVRWKPHVRNEQVVVFGQPYVKLAMKLTFSIRILSSGAALA